MTKKVLSNKRLALSKSKFESSISKSNANAESRARYRRAWYQANEIPRENRRPSNGEEMTKKVLSNKRLALSKSKFESSISKSNANAESRARYRRAWYQANEIPRENRRPSKQPLAPHYQERVDRRKETPTEREPQPYIEPNYRYLIIVKMETNRGTFHGKIKSKVPFVRRADMPILEDMVKSKYEGLYPVKIDNITIITTYDQLTGKRVEPY